MKKRIFAALLCVIMLFGMLPITALAAEPTAHAVTIARTGEFYEDLGEAVAAAESGDTIQLGEGNYTLYGVDSTGHTRGKDLTFVGLGADKTTWNIGTPTDPAPANFLELNSDYSFKGSKTIVFQDMTLRAAVIDGIGDERIVRGYTGFSHTNNTVVEDCIIEGQTYYWGYNSAEFKNTKFIATDKEYALFAYSSEKMTIENCVFNVAGKTVKIYNEGRTDIDLTFKNNKVISAKEKYAVINIDDSYSNFTVHVEGNNEISGPVAVDNGTCSRMFGFSKGTCNKGKTTVYIENTKVWENRNRFGDHAQNFKTGSYDNGFAPGKLNQYTEGYKDNAFTENAPKKWDWNEENGCYTRTVSRTCDYCGYYEDKEENGYLVSYDLNGGEPADENEKYEAEIVAEGTPIALKAAPSKDGYVFAGWSDGDTTYNAGDAVVVEQAMTFTAQWKLEGEEIIAGMTGLLTVAGLGTDDHIAYVYGYPDGTVRPNETITRAEVTTIFYRLLTSARRDEIFTSENSFRDVNSSMWYNKATSSMAAGGYIQGYADGTFGANKPITRAEFVCLAARFATKTTGFASYTDVDNGHWAARSIAICASNGWVQGYEDGTFRPDQPITRAEAMTIINRMLGRGVSKGYVCKGAVRYTDNDPGSWYYYEILEATNDHEYRNARPFEQWIRATILRSYDMDKYERP